VDRALDVLEALARRPGPTGVSELAATTGLPFGTAHRLLRALVARGYARQDADRRYALGAALLRLGEAAHRTLAAGARPHLASLVELSGETANLAVREGDRVVYLAQVPSPRTLRMFAEVGRAVHAHSTAVGKVLLAALPAEEVAGILARQGLPRRTDTTITDEGALRSELDRVRAAGYALDDGEEETGVRCLAVPVSDGGAVVAAVSVSGPADRLSEQTLESLLPAVRRVAGELAASRPGTRS
jgi:IclR family acetate operon transcriptional repressor